MRAERVAAGRGWAYAGAVLGGAVSVAANIAHSYVPPAGTPAGWQPPGGAVAFAVVWPVFLFVAVEILARVDWRRAGRWGVVRYAGLLPVALVAAGVSYRHLSGLLAFYGEDRPIAAFGPLAVDGLMVMATGALIATAGRRAADGLAVETPAPESPVPAGPDKPAAPRTGTASRPRTGTASRPRTGTARTGRTARRTGTRTDADLITALGDVPREADGTVPVRRAAAALHCGPDRARRLLAEAGLLRRSEPAPTGDPAEPAPVAA
jgi:hypothetical protein